MALRRPGRPVDPDAPAGPPLLLGMYADVQIAGRDQGPYLLLPAAAVHDGARVWRLDDQDMLQIVPVQVLGEFNDQVAVGAAPFAAGQRIVTSDLRAVTEGMRVRSSASPAADRRAAGQT
ncbi:MAG: hypothetical protein R3E83_11600 [Burkholderiaceae bacterium]